MTEQPDRKLQQHLMLARRVEGDRLMLPDEVMTAALTGARHLTEAERSALQASPLTLRRFRALAQQMRHAAWKGSRGMLRAASGMAQLATLSTDDGCWTLHFVEQDGAWRVILALAPQAPFAGDLAREAPLLRVTDGAGGELLTGRLDADGEFEDAWRPALPPAAHFQAHGASFAVQPVR